MSDLDLYADLSVRKLITSDGGTVTLPVFVLGDQCVCSLRMMEHGEGDVLREKQLNVRSLRASIGLALEPPTDGTFTLRFAGDASANLNPASSAADMQNALKALDPANTYQLQEAIVSAPGCWLLRFATTNAVPLAVAINTLKPESFIRIRAFEESGRRWHEVRLVQTPAVFTGSHERVLPPPPSVTRIRGGSTDGEFKQNEVQALIVPSDFKGTYYLRWDFRTTKLLGIDDGPQEIAAALNAMFTSGGAHFNVSNPEADHAYIEFINDLGNTPQPLIEVSVHSFEPGVLTFTLNLARAELASALRGVPQVTLPLEIEIEVVDDDQNAANPAVAGRLITLCQQPVTIAREQIWEEMADIPAIDWLRPPQPRDYIPFTRDQIITGVQHYVAVFGNGIQRSFDFPHNLGTEAFHLTVRENRSGGKVLDTFDATIASANELVLDFPESQPPPAPASLALVITSAGPVSAFQAHTHTMAQIIGLVDALFALGSRVAAIENLLPKVQPTLPAASSTPMDIQIPDRTELFPGRLPAGFDPKSLSGGNTASAMPRAAGLLPAIHDATVQPITVPLPSAAANAGNVFQNNTATPLLVPGGLGRRGGYLEAGGFAGSDGRVWYRLTHVAGTTSYFPADFERELFLFHVNEQMLRAGQSLKLEFDLALQLLQASGCRTKRAGSF